MDDTCILQAGGLSPYMLESTDSDTKILPFLSIYQRSSFFTLRAWLKLRQMDPNIEKDAREAESRASGKGIPRPHTYHEVMATLKHCEFLKKLDALSRLFKRRKAVNLSHLAHLRRQALYYAACERISSSYWHLPGPAAIFRWELEQPLFGASIAGKISLISDSPHFLWDSHRNEVRTTAMINREDGPFPHGVPEYVAISHSWVRWQDHTALPLQLPGVPWEVPQNTKFKIEELPGHLAKLKLPWRYFWIDLLTIPQGDALEPDLLAHQDWEIKCVPQIFRKAAKAFAWLDDVPSWTSLPAALTYLALEYLSVTPRTGIDKARLSSSLDLAKTVADNPLEVLEHDKNRQKPATKIWKPNAFFTSPWSLQEIISRPDMWVCNGNWEFLRISDDVPLGLNDIAALLQVFEETHGVGATLPLSVQELFQLYKRTGLVRLLDMTTNTSVKLFESVDGIAPAGVRRFPQIVEAADGFNPHTIPARDGPRYTHNLPPEDPDSSEL